MTTLAMERIETDAPIALCPDCGWPDEGTAWSGSYTYRKCCGVVITSEVSPYGARVVEDTVAYTMLSHSDREAVDAAVFRIQRMNEALTRAQERGDRAAQLIVEGQLASMRMA